MSCDWSTRGHVTRWSPLIGCRSEELNRRINEAATIHMTPSRVRDTFILRCLLSLSMANYKTG